MENGVNVRPALGTRLGRTVIESTAPSLVVTYASSAAFAAPRSAFIWDMGLRYRRSTATAARAPVASFYGHRNRPLRCLQAAGAKVAIRSASGLLEGRPRLAPLRRSVWRRILTTDTMRMSVAVDASASPHLTRRLCVASHGRAAGW